MISILSIVVLAAVTIWLVVMVVALVIEIVERIGGGE